MGRRKPRISGRYVLLTRQQYEAGMEEMSSNMFHGGYLTRRALGDPITKAPDDLFDVDALRAAEGSSDRAPTAAPKAGDRMWWTVEQEEVTVLAIDVHVRGDDGSVDVTGLGTLRPLVSAPQGDDVGAEGEEGKR